MPTITERVIPDDSLRALSDGQIEVREATVLLRDGVIDASHAPQYRRYVLLPGTDLTGKSPRIVAMAGALWTSKVVSDFKAAQASEKPPFSGSDT